MYIYRYPVSCSTMTQRNAFTIFHQRKLRNIAPLTLHYHSWHLYPLQRFIVVKTCQQLHFEKSKPVGNDTLS